MFQDTESQKKSNVIIRRNSQRQFEKLKYNRQQLFSSTLNDFDISNAISFALKQTGSFIMSLVVLKEEQRRLQKKVKVTKNQAGRRNRRAQTKRLYTPHTLMLVFSCKIFSRNSFVQFHLRYNSRQEIPVLVSFQARTHHEVNIDSS